MGLFVSLSILIVTKATFFNFFTSVHSMETSYTQSTLRHAWEVSNFISIFY